MLNIVLSVIFLIASILLTLATRSIPGGGKWDILGPRFFPRLILISGGILSLIILINSLRAYGKERVQRAGDDETAFFKSYGDIIVIFVAMFLFLVFFEFLGFLMTALTFLILLQWYLGNRRFKISTFLVPAIAVICIYVVFTRYLNVLFPTGPLEVLLNLA